MKFSDFKNKQSASSNTNKENKPENEIEKKKIEEMIASFSSLSKEELLDEFFKLSREKQKDGSLNDGEISKVKNTLSPYLTEEQKENLDKIINLVR